MSSIRRNSGVYRGIAWVSLVSFVFMCALPPSASASEIVKVQGGVSVVLRTSQNIMPTTVQVGDPIDLIVANDVKVKNKVVIKAGARAVGTVSESSKANFLGIPGKVRIELHSVEAVDETSISIRGGKSVEGEDKMVLTIVLTLICLPFFLIKGGNAVVASGGTIDAVTVGTSEVTVE